MARPPLRPLPPRGSTDWGALQFYRLLEDEERIAAEREHLRKLGWQPPQPTAATEAADFSLPNGSGSGPSGPVLHDDRDAYADLIHQKLVHRSALEDEARRRVVARLGRPSPARDVSASNEPTPGWVGAGRFGVPIPPRHVDPRTVSSTASAMDVQTFGPLIGRSGGGRGDLVAAFVAITTTLIALMSQMPRSREEWVALNRKIEAAQFNYRRLTHQMAAEFSQEEIARIKAASGLKFDILEQERPTPPRDFDPEEADRIQQEFGGPSVNIPPIIDNPPESFPIAEEEVPTFEIFPDQSDEIDQITILEVNPWGIRGNPDTRIHLVDVQRAFEAENRALIESGRLKHVGGGINWKTGKSVKERAVLGPGSAWKDDEDGLGGDGRPGMRIPDLLYELDGEKFIAINTVDVDANGQIAQREHDQAWTLRRAGVQVFLIKKPHQMPQ